METESHYINPVLNLQHRKSDQFLMPEKNDDFTDSVNKYQIYPSHAIGNDKIFRDYTTLAQWIALQKTVVIDGYAGVFWDNLKAGLAKYFTDHNLKVNWIDTTQFLKPAQAIEKIVQPFLGSDDSVWGTKTTLSLIDFFDSEKLNSYKSGDTYDLNIVFGFGAALFNREAAIIYIDLPKNELQFRMRAGSITNLGNDCAEQPFQMYKRFYFVDWVVLNQHKKALLNKIDIVADGQWLDTIHWMFKNDLTAGLNAISQSVFRVRPWFEPGVWGGQWIKHNIDQLNKEVPNYAWSFEMIVPENGLVFESSGNLLEVSFDFLMFHNAEQVL
ncbi:MAG: hypothetical protein EOP45_06695, partial [Sphingobacteriaceae bacterium]